MSPSYSSSKNRRYRYYVCIRAAQRNGAACTTLAVSAPVVEEAVIESVRRFVLAPEVVEEAARAARQRLTEELNRHREELKAVNVRVRNAKSQLVRATTLDATREAELRELIAAGDAKAEELRKAVARGERLRFDESLVRQHLGNFDEVWKTMGRHSCAASNPSYPAMDRSTPGKYPRHFATAAGNSDFRLSILVMTF